MRPIPRGCYPCPLFVRQTELEGKNMKPLRFARILRAALAACALAAAPAIAATTGFERCPQFFVHGQVPKVHRLESVRPRALCFSSFAVMYSGLTKTPLYVAERLSAAQVARAREERRTNRFFADARLPSVERAELADYKGSGFDRGHMAPAGDMANDTSMAQSFSLSNMVPQAPENNRKAWAGIEKATRKYVLRAHGDVYVITGPVFVPPSSTIGPHRVWVPHYLYKLVYDATTHRAWAHWIQNTDTARVSRPISYRELVKRTGVDFLPGVPVAN
ncbi:DNA/RNA non-specific endonuclease [Ralstonia pseudosolanacearum]|uniref:Endonuclease n=1 Tax=Ralstonia solanacearum TaxID=305 RepID=A0AA92Q753_RALSL|nr:DNA/RNA non-specific endonuclease [Ralstonia pseudosolanacearum]QOK92578.1 DNA/RNA non-specific endonuclease [Ralstonia pseudosolanacearum]QOK97471.1 DNA/RNA non-specific endonuclease [Ralstonia pseudosolanacearum]UWD90235.1 DNA/RNA non-specific endonuclease [Ralstonia pseudosolanacearum]